MVDRHTEGSEKRCTCTSMICLKFWGCRLHRRSALLANTPSPEHGTSSSTLSNLPALRCPSASSLGDPLPADARQGKSQKSSISLLHRKWVRTASRKPAVGCYDKQMATGYVSRPYF